jgi:hypothetical protein
MKNIFWDLFIVAPPIGERPLGADFHVNYAFSV